MEDEESQELLATFKSSINSLIRKHIASNIPATDANELLGNLERILKHKLKERVNGSSITYWNLLSHLAKVSPASEVEALEEMQREVEETRHDWSTEEAKGRCWLRMALNTKRILMLKYFTEDHAFLSNWYEPMAFLMYFEYASIFINLLVGLETVTFNLSLLDPAETGSTDLEVIQTFRVKKTRTATKKGTKPSTRRRKDKKGDVGVPPTTSPPLQLSQELRNPKDKQVLDTELGERLRKIEEERLTLVYGENDVSSPPSSPTLSPSSSRCTLTATPEAGLRANVITEQVQELLKAQQQQELLRQEQERIKLEQQQEQQRIEQERLRLEEERLKLQQQHEQQRLEQEQLRLEQERLRLEQQQVEKRREVERLRLEQERLKREQELELEQLRLEEEEDRLKQEQEKKERIRKEQEEQDRIKRELEEEQERMSSEEERKEAELLGLQEEQEQLRREQEEQERIRQEQQRLRQEEEQVCLRQVLEQERVRQEQEQERIKWEQEEQEAESRRQEREQERVRLVQVEADGLITEQEERRRQEEEEREGEERLKKVTENGLREELSGQDREEKLETEERKEGTEDPTQQTNDQIEDQAEAQEQTQVDQEQEGPQEQNATEEEDRIKLEHEEEERLRQGNNKQEQKRLREEQECTRQEEERQRQVGLEEQARHEKEQQEREQEDRKKQEQDLEQEELRQMQEREQEKERKRQEEERKRQEEERRKQEEQEKIIKEQEQLKRLQEEQRLRQEQEEQEHLKHQQGKQRIREQQEQQRQKQLERRQALERLQQEQERLRQEQEKQQQLELQLKQEQERLKQEQDRLKAHQEQQRREQEDKRKQQEEQELIKLQQEGEEREEEDDRKKLLQEEIERRIAVEQEKLLEREQELQERQTGDQSDRVKPEDAQVPILLPTPTLERSTERLTDEKDQKRLRIEVELKSNKREEEVQRRLAAERETIRRAIEEEQKSKNMRLSLLEQKLKEQEEQTRKVKEEKRRIALEADSLKRKGDEISHERALFEKRWEKDQEEIRRLKKGWRQQAEDELKEKRKEAGEDELEQRERDHLLLVQAQMYKQQQREQEIRDEEEDKMAMLKKQLEEEKKVMMEQFKRQLEEEKEEMRKFFEQEKQKMLADVLSPGPTLKRDQNQELEQEERREKEDYFGSRRHDSDRYERPSSRDMFREGRNGYGREGQVSYQTISASVPVRSSFPADIRRESVDSPRILNSYHSAGEGFYEFHSRNSSRSLSPSPSNSPGGYTTVYWDRFEDKRASTELHLSSTKTGFGIGSGRETGSYSPGENSDEDIQYMDDSADYPKLTLDDFLNDKYDPSKLPRNPWNVISDDTGHDVPDSEPVDDLPIEIRTQTEWTPPKRQLLFLEHPRGKPADQNNLCWGCGMKLPTGWFKSPNYCRYSCKYFCSTCHENFKFLIPAKILKDWDFKYYPISNFYREFLKTLYFEPLFDLSVVAPTLFDRVPALKNVQLLRSQLGYMKDFVLTCRDKERLIKPLAGKLYIVDTKLYSLSDLVDIYQDKFVRLLREIAELWIKHIMDCELCGAKGSVCEFCKKKEIIYPFNLLTTTQCPKCKSVAHKECYNSQQCPKCLRIQLRKQSTQLVGQTQNRFG